MEPKKQLVVEQISDLLLLYGQVTHHCPRRFQKQDVLWSVIYQLAGKTYCWKGTTVSPKTYGLGGLYKSLL